MISDDLVNSYHLLLCALDLVYGNALQCPNRKELLNPNFKGTLKTKLSTFIQSLQGLLRLLKLGWIYVEENKFNNIDFKYVGINIFYVRLRSQVSINVVCNNRLLNFVSNIVSQERNLLWKYHWRNFQVKIC